SVAGVVYKIADVETSGLSNVEVAMCVFSPGEVADLHYHEQMEEIYFVIEGEGEIELNGRWFPVNAEDTVVVPLMTRHRILNKSQEKVLRFLSINSPFWRQEDMIRLKPD
ncbi:MAG: cupin domain-containing protein, partial [Bacteroidetes bacterium]|nr:cupin domain-containing protein [Bacteroidota bacterium]